MTTSSDDSGRSPRPPGAATTLRAVAAGGPEGGEGAAGPDRAPARVVVADAQPLFAEALATALGVTSGYDVIPRYPTTGEDAVRLVADAQPDVVLVDFWLPGIDGPAATRSMLVENPRAKVLVLSWFHGSAHVRQALLAGAVGFLPKSLSLGRVAEAVGRALTGEAVVFGVELARLVEDIDRRADEADRDARLLASLTARELEVVELLSHGLPLKQIAQRLAISPGTVKNHLHSILRKTGRTTQLEVVALARYARVVGDVHPADQARTSP